MLSRGGRGPCRGGGEDAVDVEASGVDGGVVRADEVAPGPRGSSGRIGPCEVGPTTLLSVKVIDEVGLFWDE